MSIEIIETDSTHMDARIADVVPAGGRLIAFATTTGAADIWHLQSMISFTGEARRIIGHTDARASLLIFAKNLVAIEDTMATSVWVPGTTWRPGGKYHAFQVRDGRADRTRCGINEINFTGTIVTMAEANDDWRQPCSKCYNVDPVDQVGAPSPAQDQASFDYAVQHGIAP